MSNLKRLLFVALGLGVIAVAVNWLDPTRSLTKLVRGEVDLQGRPTSHATPGKMGFQGQAAPNFKPRTSIEPIGSEKAKVRIQVFTGFQNHCHAQTIETFETLGKAAPELLRVEFVNTNSEAGRRAAQEANINCEAGVLINGKQRFELEGEKFPIEFHGPLGMGVSPHLVKKVLDHELRRQYGDDLKAETLAKIDQVWDHLPMGQGGMEGMGPMGPMGAMGPSGAAGGPAPSPSAGDDQAQPPKGEGKDE